MENKVYRAMEVYSYPDGRKMRYLGGEPKDPNNWRLVEESTNVTQGRNVPGIKGLITNVAIGRLHYVVLRVLNFFAYALLLQGERLIGDTVYLFLPLLLFFGMCIAAARTRDTSTPTSNVWLFVIWAMIPFIGIIPSIYLLFVERNPNSPFPRWGSRNQ
jgi:hypothetical protein